MGFTTQASAVFKLWVWFLSRVFGHSGLTPWSLAGSVTSQLHKARWTHSTTEALLLIWTRLHSGTIGQKIQWLGYLPFPRAYHSAFEKGVEMKAVQQPTECTTQRTKIDKRIQTYTVVGPCVSGPVFSSVLPSLLPMNSMARKGLCIKWE